MKLNMKDQVVSETTVSREQIALMAYEVWNKAGRPQGRDWEFWFEAERQLRETAKQAPVTPESEPVPASASARNNSVSPVARVEPARLQPAPANAAKKAARKSPGPLGGAKSRV